MAGFFYFLTRTQDESLVRGGGQLDRKVLADHRLDVVLRDVQRVPTHAIVTPCAKGPGGVPGLVLYPVPVGGDVPDLIGYHPEQQTWTKCGGNTTWIGYLKDRPPTPQDLARRSQIPGYTVGDAAGRSWLIPAVRGNAHYPAPYGALPGEFVWDDDGSPTLELAPEMEHLWRRSERVWDYLTGAGGTVLERGYLAGVVLQALQYNYRIGPRELTVLQRAGLAAITSRNLEAFLHSLCDVEAIEQYRVAKKKDSDPSAAAGSDSSIGSPAETDAGDQPVENCG